MLYHLSTDGNLSVLTPRVPECAVESIEDTTIKRVCFSDFIGGCLSALQSLPGVYYVYIPDQELSEEDIHHPTVYEARDAEYTHEVWVMKEVKVKCIGAIRTDDYDWAKVRNSGRGNVIFLHYPYEWIERKV